MSDDRYTGYAPCPCCFESCGFVCEFGTDWDSGPYVHQTRIPCRECEGTGYVEADVRTLDDLENEEWAPATSAWVESIRELVNGHAA